MEVFMKRFLISICLAAACVAGVGAQEAPQPSATQSGLSAALQEMSAAQLGTLTVADVVELASRISIAEQKVRYVQKARMASFMLPGAGQLMAGDAVGGSLYLAGDVLLFAGTVVGSYFLLPADLQFGSLDYLNSPVSTIKSLWESHSVVDYLPTWGVMAGGMLLKAVLGHLSARSAAEEARANVSSGKVTFTPDLQFVGLGMGPGMSMMMRMRY
jgi:hypothetical protein